MPVNTLEKRFTQYPKEPTIFHDYNHAIGDDEITNLNREQFKNNTVSNSTSSSGSASGSFFSDLLNGITSLLSLDPSNMSASSKGLIYTGLVFLIIIPFYSFILS